MVYVALFSLSATQIGRYVAPPVPFVNIIVVLLVFVFSALVSGGIILGYPLFLAMGGDRRSAIRILSWSIFWIALLLLAVLSVAVLTTSNVMHAYGA